MSRNLIWCSLLFLVFLGGTGVSVAAHERGGIAGSSGDYKLGENHHKFDKVLCKAHVPSVKQSIQVNASPEHVWQAIQHERKADHHRRLLSYDGTAATLHETFASLPIVGEASCDYVENESSLFQRIDYSLVKSDRFAVFQGSWIISPGKNGSSNVELSNELDPGIRVPFWQDITRVAAGRLVKKRLESVCIYAEQLQKSEDLHTRSGNACEISFQTMK